MEYFPGAMTTLREAGAAQIVTTNTIKHPTNAIDVSVLVARQVERFRTNWGGAARNADDCVG